MSTLRSGSGSIGGRGFFSDSVVPLLKVFLLTAPGFASIGPLDRVPVLSKSYYEDYDKQGSPNSE